MKSFKVNEFITLKLEEERTVIYVVGEQFQQCKFLLLSIPIDEVTNLTDIESVDEAAEKLDHSLEHNQTYYEIPPETEFWGHCSNLQVWAENDYDTRILKSDLAFPLLKKLVENGDTKAERVFKKEITKRLSSGYYNVIEYLFEQNYIKFLGNKELWKIIIPSLEKLTKDNYQVRWWIYSTELPLLLLRRLVDLGDNVALQLLKEVIIEILQTENITNIGMLYDGEYINLLSRDEFWSVFGEDGKILHEFEKKIKQFKMITYKNSSGIYITEKKIKTQDEYCYFNLSNGVYIDNGPMMFTFRNNHVTGIGIWSDEKNIFEINQIPNSTFRMIYIEEIVLSRVSLKVIPSDIKNFEILKSLSLSENMLKNIPVEICELKQLEYLGLGWNQLIDLPKCLENLKNLKKLLVFDNPLAQRTKILLENLKRKRENFILYINTT